MDSILASIPSRHQIEDYLKSIYNDITCTSSKIDLKPSSIAIANHSFRNMTATSSSNTGKYNTINIYDNNNSNNANNNEPNLTIDLPHNQIIYTLSWSPTSDIIYAGTSSGIFSKKLKILSTSIGIQSTAYLENPKKSPIHSITFSPDGRLFTSTTQGDRDILIWDSITQECISLYILDGGKCSNHIAWSPSGLNLVIAAQDSNSVMPGGLVMLETYGWTRSSHSLMKSIACVAWIDESHCIYTLDKSNTIYLLSMDSSRPIARELSAQPLPIELDVLLFSEPHEELIISNIVTESIGHYMAVLFDNKSDGDHGQCVAVYLVNPFYTLSVTLLTVLKKTDYIPKSMQFAHRQKNNTRASNGTLLVVLWQKNKETEHVELISHPIFHQ